MTSRQPYLPQDPKFFDKPTIILLILLALSLFFGVKSCRAENAPEWAKFSNEQIARAIYFAEGGTATTHPYGILAHYKHTTPRQACLNTIAHARRDFQGGDFIAFLGNRYCPVGAKNDPTGLNKNWVKNVKRLLQKARS